MPSRTRCEPRGEAVRVLVTGAAGFVGRALTTHLLESGVPVRALVRRRNDELARHGAECVVGDLLDERVVRAATRDVDVVYHAAAVVPGRAGDLWEVNVEGTRRLAMACSAESVRRLVFTSSVAAYRPPLAPLIDEDAPIGGMDLYGRSKAAAETVIRETCGDTVEYVILRPCQIYGPDDRSGYTVRLEALARRRWLPVCRGVGRFSLVHVDDVARAMQAAGSHHAAAGRVFNVAGPRHVSLRELSDALADGGSPARHIVIPRTVARAALSVRRLLNAARNSNIRPFWRSYSPRATHGSLWLGGPDYSNERARSVLGFTPVIDPFDALGGESSQRPA